jgi:hypothetical protein
MRKEQLPFCRCYSASLPHDEFIILSGGNNLVDLAMAILRAPGTFLEVTSKADFDFPPENP